MGYLFVIIASVLFGIFPSIQTKAMNNGATPLAMVALSFGIAALFSFFVALIRRESFRLSKAALPHVLLAGAGLFVTNVLLDVAYTLIPVGFATMIHFLFPSLVCLTMAVFFKQKLTPGKIAAIFMSILGLLLISGGGIGGNVRGILAALCTTVAYATYMIENDISPVARLPQSVCSFYLNLVTSLMAFALIGIKGGAVFPAWPGPMLMTVLGGVMLGVGVISLSYGIRILGTVVASFFNMVEPLTSFAVSFFVFRYAVSGMAFTGCVLILGALLLIAVSGRGDAAGGRKNAAGG